MTVAVAEQTARKKWARRRGKLGEHVAGVVGGLQARATRDQPDPEAVGALARLRRGVGREPGSDYTLERYLLVPERLIRYLPADGPADEEYAAHDAVTLYAAHQQSQNRPMHATDIGLGIAISQLVNKADGPEGVRRRFAALGTASSSPEAVYHLRSLVTMLRGAEVPLDYGLLADDLLELRKPDGSTRVRAAWGREFFRARPASDSDTTPATPAAEAPEE